ncbi:MAG: chemotaxis protein CheW [Flammeovirgaceae bacterium]
MTNNKALEVTIDEKSSYKNHQIIVFKIGGEEYGLMIDQIKEVVLTPRIAKIPLMPSYIKGVANIRGNILAIIDLEEKFGLKNTVSHESDEGQKNYSLVVESDKYNMAILVREVPNTLSVSDADIDRSPSVVSGGDSKNYIKGIVKLDTRLVILIDAHQIISREELNKVISRTTA